MGRVRPAVALDPRAFGRRALLPAASTPHIASSADDLRLFLMTFAAGFLFVSIFLG